MLCKNPCSALFAALLALILVSGALMQGTGGSGSSSGGAKYPSGSLLNGDYSTVLDNDLPPGAHKDFINYQDNDQDKAALHAALSRLTPDAAAALRQGKAVQVYNNTSGWCEIVFDLRAATNPLLTKMLDSMNTMAQSTALAYGGRLTWTQIDYCPASDYDPELVAMIEESIRTQIGPDKLVPPTGGGGEDFHFYKVKKPSVRTAYFGVGVGAAPGLHKRDMTFQTQYMVNGVKVWKDIARKLLG